MKPLKTVLVIIALGIIASISSCKKEQPEKDSGGRVAFLSQTSVVWDEFQKGLLREPFFVYEKICYTTNTIAKGGFMSELLKTNNPVITIRIPTALRQYVGNNKDVIVLFYEGMTVGQALCFLVHKHESLEKHLFQEDLKFCPETGVPLGAQLRNFIVVYVNDEDIRYFGGGNMILKPGSLVSIAASIAGG